MAKSIPGQSSLFSPETSTDSASAISSPASAGGRMLSGSQAGPILEKSGREVVPVSRSRALAPKLGAPIRATFGRRGFGSSASADLGSSLVNRLRARLPTGGSTLFAMTWKEKATPSGRVVCLLRASALRISGPGSGSWRSPAAQNADRGGQDASERVAAGHTVNLQDQVTLASWPSPVTNDAKGSDYAYSSGDHDRPALKLGGVAKLATWATPAARDWRSNEASDEHYQERARQTRGKPLSEQAHQLASWPSLMAGSPATKEYNEAGDTCNGRKARLLVSGQIATGSHAEMGGPGQLNPAHSRWLMGYPPEWDACAVTAMPSSRKLPRRSSPHISTAATRRQT